MTTTETSPSMGAQVIYPQEFMAGPNVNRAAVRQLVPRTFPANTTKFVRLPTPQVELSPGEVQVMLITALAQALSFKARLRANHALKDAFDGASTRNRKIAALKAMDLLWATY